MPIQYMTPRGTQDAWVGNELRVVARAGLAFALHSLEAPRPTFFASPEIRDMPTRAVYPLARFAFVGSLLLAPWLFGRRFAAALLNALFGPRESLTVRLKGLWHLAVACHWARMLRHERSALIHAQWAHSSGTVAMYGAWLLGTPFSFTGHGADLCRDRASLADKIRRADFIVCISSFHRDLYLREGARPEQLTLAYCGIDTDHFAPRQVLRDDGLPLRILSSGRLVEKKGFADVIAACEILRERGVAFECVIAGSGPLEADLRERVRRAKLDGLVRVTGEPLKQETMPDFMRDGDVFCLPCVCASDGDMDGLPQMLMEAMACGLPVVSTRLVGIPDLVVDGETGLLVSPGDVAALASALERLARNPELSAALASAGRERVVERFDLRSCLEPLLERFRAHLTAS
jgi:glycosyltransferase involved in cell wall biosynthesis